MPKLSCDISESLMQAVAVRSTRTGEPLSHIVMSALADALEVDHSTLFQVSTSGRCVKGVYNGVVTVGDLKQHGDFGLGTYDGLDGEMLALDGHFYQVHSSGRGERAEQRCQGAVRRDHGLSGRARVYDRARGWLRGSGRPARWRAANGEPVLCGADRGAVCTDPDTCRLQGGER